LLNRSSTREHERASAQPAEAERRDDELDPGLDERAADDREDEVAEGHRRPGDADHDVRGDEDRDAAPEVADGADGEPVDDDVEQHRHRSHEEAVEFATPHEVLDPVDVAEGQEVQAVR